MEVSGKIIATLPPSRGVSQRTGNEWCTQTYVLETFGQYPRKIPFEVFGEDRIRQFDIRNGETVTISFDIDGREWNGKWFTKISCFNVRRENQQSQQQQVQNTVQQPQQFVAAPPPPPPAHGGQTAGSDDDLPFSWGVGESLTPAP